MKKKRHEYNVLVLEDKPHIQEEIVAIIKDLGYNVSGVASSYEEAMDAAEQTFPDVALCDINIIGYKDGIAFANDIKKKSDVAIVYLTVETDPEVVDEALKVNPGAYIIKSKMDEQNLGVQLQIAIENLELQQTHRTTVFDGMFGIWSRGTCYQVEADAILYVKGNNNECLVVTNEEMLDVNQRLKEIVPKLEKFGIRQVHKSYAINMNKVRAYDRGPTFIELNYKYLASDLKSKVARGITVSKSYRKQLRVEFGMQ